MLLIKNDFQHHIEVKSIAIEILYFIDTLIKIQFISTTVRISGFPLFCLSFYRFYYANNNPG